MARFAVRKASSELPSVCLGLGSNLGERESNLISALEGLVANGMGLEAVSSCYRTVPQGGPPGQNDYLNLACQVGWINSGLELLELCQRVEEELGRERDQRWGARSIDIDILLMGRRIIVKDRLLVPHPLMVLRAFVLVPLTEIAGDLVHPVLGKTIASLLSELATEAVIGLHPWGTSAQQHLDELLIQKLK